MSDKQLKDKAINLHGNEYVQVSDRVVYFNDKYPNGAIRTRLLSDTSVTHYVVEAKVIPDVDKPERYFSGLSQAKLGDSGANKDAALENAETSAVGRALGMLGIGVIDSIASADELKKANVSSQNRSYSSKQSSSTLATDKQRNAVLKMAKKTGREISLERAENMTKQEASQLIETMMKELG